MTGRIDNFHNKLNINLVKKRKYRREPFKSSKIPKFGWKML